MSLSPSVTARDRLVRWRSLIPSRWRFSTASSPREIAALGFLINGWEPAQYVELSKLLLVVLYDEQRESRRLALRLCGYSAKIVPHGVQWGGPSQRRFCRDLALVPFAGAKRSRIDLSSGSLLDLAFQMEARIQ